jgi:hypothetical protein
MDFGYVIVGEIVIFQYLNYVFECNNNNNNNLFLRSRPSKTLNWCMRPFCLWDKRPLQPRDLTGKVY